MMFGDILVILEILAQVAELADAVANFAALWEAIGNTPDYGSLTYEQRKDILKRVTKIVVNLNLDLACFPLGYDTVILFDTNGNPVP